jgi:predicted metal-dependent peptidase
MNMTNAKAGQKVTKARANLVMSQPFFGSLALRLKVIEDTACETAWVDGSIIGYNPTWIETLTVSEVTGVMAHEVMHLAMLHHTRRSARNSKKWNIAADYVINLIIDRAGFILPKDRLLNPAYDKMSTEHVYSILPDEDLGNGDPGGCGEVRDSPNSTSDSQRKAEEADWKVAVATALLAAKQTGTLPADLARLIDEIFIPVLPWKDLLRRFMTEKTNDDFSWRHGNRRFLSSGLYLPSRESEASGEIVVIIDTSGSIGEKELNEFGSEINGIHKEVRPSKLHVIYCDSIVNHVDCFSPDDEIELSARGGGGTNFAPPFTYMDEHGIEPKCAVYLTDGYGPFPKEENISFPVMWAINNHEITPPFGEHLILDTN